MNNLEEVQKAIDVLKNNLDTLPQTKPADIKKYNNYINEMLTKYQNDKKNIELEMKKRFSTITKLNENPEIANFDNKINNYDLRFLLDKYKGPLEKFDLEQLLYRLDHFYKADLDTVNKNILFVLKLYKKNNISIEFNYSPYIKEYIDVLLNSPEKIHKIFDQIYWKCPEIIKYIELNIYSAYIKNKELINKIYCVNKTNFFKTKKEVDYLFDYLNLIKQKELLIDNDLYSIVQKFKKNQLIIGAFYPKMIGKLIEKYNINDEGDWERITDLYHVLIEYQNYLKFKYLIDDVKAMYKEKDKNKGLLNQRIKEVQRIEKKLFKINRQVEKINTKKLFKNEQKDHKKKEELMITINNLLVEINAKYEEVRKDKVKDYASSKLTDYSSLYDALLFSYSLYNYNIDKIKENNEGIDDEEIKDIRKEIKDILFYPHTTLINNQPFLNEIDFPIVIMDKYKLFDINIEVSMFEEDTIDGTIDELYNLIIYHNIKDKLNIDDVEFFCKASKIMETIKEPIE